MPPIAHTKPDSDSTHDLAEHLQETAKLAKIFAEPTKGGELAYIAGLWHDLGKYQKKFQYKIQSDTHLKVDHSSVGAIYAIEQFKKIGELLAFLIVGHHGGLRDKIDIDTRLNSQEKKQLLNDTLKEFIPDAILHPPQLTDISYLKGRDYSLFIRLLFSCLVDADFLDTEKFMNPEKTNLRGNYPPLIELLPKFQIYIQTLTKKSTPTALNQIRKNILEICIQAGEKPTGLFSLTVPTGGGKTLSSLAFALHHAIKHEKKRIIYVIPYTSIIEQTANIFRDIFGEAIIEHHSNLDPLDSAKETPASRIACENWDAPIIVTTSVQFFESLFAAQTSRVRKLHNILNSVVILDEAQLLPVDFLKPILHLIRDLSKYYGVSFLFSTATQPALQSEKTAFYEFEGLDNIQELVPNPVELIQKLQRVTFELPEKWEEARNWESLAAELKTYSQVLCVVNRRQDCRDLHALMPAGTIHLSALMCGEHRSQVIKFIKEKLAKGDPIRVISTQLVEAGVDIDFPVVYRALAGLDSIAQAAGRCNREGKLADKGKVVIFVPPSQSPSGILRRGEEITCKMFKKFGRYKNLLEVDNFKNYFSELYWQSGKKLDSKDIINSAKSFNFKTVSDNFRLIDDIYQPVIVQYGNNQSLLKQLYAQKVSRYLLRQLQRYIVNIPRNELNQCVNEGIVEVVGGDIYVQKCGIDLYDDVLGFLGSK